MTTITKFKVTPQTFGDRQRFMLSYLLGDSWRTYPAPFTDRNVATRQGKALLGQQG